jgi:hypothetical protein
MTIQEALQKAVAEGYHVHSYDGAETYYWGTNNECVVWLRKQTNSSFMVKGEDTFLDPLFWEALGRAMDWMGGEWKAAWHRFVDYFAERKTPEAFFASLS